LERVVKVIKIGYSELSCDLWKWLKLRIVRENYRIIDLQRRERLAIVWINEIIFYLGAVVVFVGI